MPVIVIEGILYLVGVYASIWIDFDGKSTRNVKHARAEQSKREALKGSAQWRPLEHLSQSTGQLSGKMVDWAENAVSSSGYFSTQFKWQTNHNYCVFSFFIIKLNKLS